MPGPGTTADAGPALEMLGVTKWFADVTALDRVDCTVASGSVHGLVGANGAGKSTLLSIAFGLVRPDEGEARLFGRTRDAAGPAWLDGVGGFVESPRFYPYLSGRANLSALAGLDHGDSRELIEPMLDLVGLSDARELKVKGYSLGMRQRLGLAAALIRRPALLILDEPTNGLDPSGIRSLREALLEAGRLGTSVLFSSHDIAQVDQLCTDVTVLDRGSVVFSGSIQRLRAEAPKPVWKLDTSDNPAAVELAASIGVGVENGDDRLQVTADQDELDRLVISLGRAGIALRLLDEASSALEVLMTRLTTGAATGAEDERPVPLGAGAT